MALSSTTIWEVQVSGDDTNGAGAFDPGQTAGMFTDGAATVANTSAPVFTSASYNFVAGDVSAWVFIGAGTNWTKGWYKITSVAANAATLVGTIGSAVIYPTAGVITPSLVVGCATVASPTGATWSIDYSQQVANQFTYTDLASVGAGALVSSAAKPFAKQHVGNGLTITGGTNFTAGRYVIASVAATVATVVGPGNITTAAGASGTGGLGGAMASPGLAGSVRPSAGNNWTFIKSGTYTITSATANVAGGVVSDTNGGASVTLPSNWEAYQTVRGDLAADAILRVNSTGVTACTIFNITAFTRVRRIQVDGLVKATIKGFSNTGSRAMFWKCSALNCTNSGFNTAVCEMIYCYATGCTTAGGGFVATDACAYLYCEAYANTVPGFSASAATVCLYDHCLSDSNTGASTDGFIGTTYECHYVSCVAYANGRDGFRISNLSEFANCIAESNVGTGFNQTIGDTMTPIINCATFGNGTAYSANFVGLRQSPVAGVSSFFSNAAGRNFALNNTTGAGAAARAAGVPGAYFSASTTGYLDIGAAQHADPTGGAGFLIQ